MDVTFLDLPCAYVSVDAMDISGLLLFVVSCCCLLLVVVIYCCCLLLFIVVSYWCVED